VKTLRKKTTHETATLWAPLSLRVSGLHL
jgi:hypothetical protein